MKRSEAVERAGQVLRYWAGHYLCESQLHPNGNERYERGLMQAIAKFDKAVGNPQEKRKRKTK